MSATPHTHVIASPRSWIEGEAVRQLEKTAQLPGIELGVGMPDLHPGKGHPIGAAFLSRGVIYPHLVGGDIGCGMALWRTSLSARKAKRDRWVDKLTHMEGPWEGDTTSWLEERGVEPTPFDDALGTIGGGNHFAELQRLEEVADPEVFEALGLDPDALYLLVHSGSRGLGTSILSDYIQRFAAAGLDVESDAAQEYLRRHDHAVRWALANRQLIAHRFMDDLNASGEQLFDLCHNSVSPRQEPGAWLHRKGAAPADGGPLVIPGSRGTLSYLVVPVAPGERSAWSLAHGAGRKWMRSDARARLKGRFTAQALTHTELGGRVICEDKDLLFEEAPQAYKDIDSVIGDLKEAGLVQIVAVLRPLITYKTRSEP